MTEFQKPTPVISFSEARAIVEREAARISPVVRETVPLEQAYGRVLAEDIRADRDQPPFPRSIRDGYALRSTELAQTPARFRVLGDIKAGTQSLPELTEPHTAWAIMTGAPVPNGADAVLMVEHSEMKNDSEIEALRTLEPGENIVGRGTEIAKGAVLIERGTRMGATAMAAAASVGAAEVSVYRKPRVAIITTGDELVDVKEQPGPYQIRNSNRWSIGAHVIAAGGEPVAMGVARDTVTDIRARVADALSSCDMVLLSGGVSMGKHDLVEGVLEDFSADFHYRGVAMQPGKPAVFCHCKHQGRSVPVFGLPGNPVSTMASFATLARTVLYALAGRGVVPLRVAWLPLAKEIRTKTGLTRFLPATISGAATSSGVESRKSQGSGDLAAMSRANCFIMLDPDREIFAANEFVPVLFPEADL
ncbi:MAG TPA: gephyrin-like molybdotransferase Glp [Terriglobales bacterium]